jgi:hypothetical protein
MHKPLPPGAAAIYREYIEMTIATHIIGYNRNVRRLLALSLLLLFSFPLVSPLFALPTNTDANLPACCRRNGAHHCQMKVVQRSSTSASQIVVSTTPTKCPFYPRPATLVQHNNAWLPVGNRLLATFIHRATVKAPAYAYRRIALDAAWQKRGPPTHIS